MFTIDRRSFLASLAGSFIASESLPAKPQAAPPMAGPCWLDVAAPFVLQDPSQQLSTELLLTATCFPGAEGYKDSRFATEYQVLLYDSAGKEIKLDNAGKLSVPAMRPTLLNMKELTGRDSFVGGARIRVAPSPHQVPRAGDLFSAGFVRWNLPGNFDNVHAHPAIPPQLMGRYNYSMPFPAMSEYHCAFALFNPNDDESYGMVRVVDRMGRKVVERRFNLHPHRTNLYTLSDLKPVETPGEALALQPLPEPKLQDGGVVVVLNESPHVSYAYTLMKGRQGQSFTVEHPLHFSADAPIMPARSSPYGPNRSFPAHALIYTPMLFKDFKAGGVELESRMYFSSSHWVEKALWKMPFVTTATGDIAWVSNRDDKFSTRIQPSALVDQGLVRLTEFQSCRIAARDLPLPEGFSGGFGAACIPKTSHSLNKIEVRAVNWGRVALTHFRPGGAIAKSYRQVEQRGSLASDYIVSDAHIIGSPSARKRDCLLAVMNIEFEDDFTGTPRIQVFGPTGLVAEKQLGDFSPLACRHFLLSELFPGLESDPAHPFTVRMQVPNALMIVSALHLDYVRQDIALEHGSDRHSTFQDVKC
jgi:hypothetical protein